MSKFSIFFLIFLGSIQNSVKTFAKCLVEKLLGEVSYFSSGVFFFLFAEHAARNYRSEPMML
jgi:hypothetical protein